MSRVSFRPLALSAARSRPNAASRCAVAHLLEARRPGGRRSAGSSTCATRDRRRGTPSSCVVPVSGRPGSVSAAVRTAPVDTPLDRTGKSPLSMRPSGGDALERLGQSRLLRGEREPQQFFRRAFRRRLLRDDARPVHGEQRKREGQPAQSMRHDNTGNGPEEAGPYVRGASRRCRAARSEKPQPGHRLHLFNDKLREWAGLSQSPTDRTGPRRSNAARPPPGQSESWSVTSVLGVYRGDVDADSIPSQRAIPARAAWRRDGCGGAGPTRARQALFRGSHEALRARRGPVVGCVALWSDGDR